MVDGKRKITSAPGRSEAGPAKRQRVSRACDQCRVAREKCDGIQPICFTCASSNRACSYTANPKKRGIQPGYIRTLELALAWLFTNCTGSEEKIKSALRDKAVERVLTGKDVDGSNRLHKKWRKNAVCKDIDRLLSGAGLGPSPSEPGSQASDDDEDEEDDAERSNVDNALPTPISQNAAASGLRADSNIRTRESGLQSHQTATSSSALKLKLPESLWRLFDVYFAYTHCWLPIVEKEDILKTAYSYPHDGLYLSPTTPRAGDHVLLWSVLAIASFQDAASSTAGSTPQQTSAMTDSDLSHSSMYKIARDLLPSDSGPFSFSHVQALIILAYISIGAQDLTAAWMLAGKALRILSIVDSRDTAAPEAISGLATPRMSHVQYACIVLETVLAAQLGCVPDVRRDQISKITPVVEDGLEEWHPWASCEGFASRPRDQFRSPVQSLSTMNRLVELFGIINDDIALRSSDRSSAASQSHKDEFKTWAASNALKCASNSLQLESNPAPPHFLLHFATRCWSVAIGTTSQISPAVGEILQLIARFERMFGVAATPPIFCSLLGIILQSIDIDVRARQSVENKIAEIRLRWTDNKPAAVPAAESNIATTESPSRRPRTPAQEAPRGYSRDFADTPLNADWNALTSPLTPKLHQPYLSDDFIPQPFHSDRVITSAPSQLQAGIQRTGSAPYEANYLHRYHSNSPMDFDALIDDLASLEGVDRRDTQPQFMQNLGFAPGANLTDVLGSDFGAFDPVLTAYMSGNALEEIGIDHSSSFDPG
jgi:Fungal specific transcription factor domain/Fungal Zn(2)-Cys(6) binuclear cluster domain